MRPVKTEELDKRIQEFIPPFFAFLKEMQEASGTDDQAIAFLGGQGLFNRLFRRWYETSFASETDSPYSQITTRSLLEHSIGAHSREEGFWYFSYFPFVEEGKGLRFDVHLIHFDYIDERYPAPLFFDQKMLFYYLKRGLLTNKNNELTKFYDSVWHHFIPGDIDFLPFLFRLLLGAQLGEIKRFKDKKPARFFLNEKGKEFFSLPQKEKLPIFLNQFLGDVSKEIAKNVFRGKIGNSLWRIEKRARIIAEWEERIKDYFNFQEDRWFAFDKLLVALWEVLHKNAPEDFCPPYFWQEKLEDFDWRHYLSQHLYLELQTLLDKKLLFPLDRYFGIVEVIWTEPERLRNTVKKGLAIAQKLSERPIYYVSEREMLRELSDMFFAPCQIFRTRKLFSSVSD